MTPNALTEQYVKRDFEGQFLEQNNWKDQISICPGQSPGSDTSTVIASYKINGLTVTYQVVGHIDAGKFEKTQASETVTVKVQKTPFGYKIIDSFISDQHISIDAAIKLASSNKLEKKYIDALKALKK